MPTVEAQIDVDVPVRVAYDQWTQFESFPAFMDGVERVVQHDDRTLTWWVTVGGIQKQWVARIVDQVPDAGISWRSTQGTENAGAVTFAPLGKDRTRITLRVDAEPDGILERMGEAMGFLDRRVEGDLKRFKYFIEARMAPTGSWRGEIQDETVVAPERRRSATTTLDQGGRRPGR